MEHLFFETLGVAVFIPSCWTRWTLDGREFKRMPDGRIGMRVASTGTSTTWNMSVVRRVG